RAAAPAQPPAAPSNLVATVGSDQKSANLSWSDNSSNETGFIIERSVAGSGVWQAIKTTGANATSYIDSTIAASTSYLYHVRATSSAAGDSANSNDAPVTIPAAPNFVYLSD